MYRIFRIPPDSPSNIAVMSYEDESRRIEEYATSLFQLNPDERFVYHNFKHTRKVVDRTNEIALFYKLKDEKLFIVKTSAWFHDICYLFTGPEWHELKAVRLMKEFVSAIISTRTLIDEIEQCIMATEKSAVPASVSEKIMCDADTYHFGTPEFKQTDPLIKKGNRASDGVCSIGMDQ